MIPGEAKPNSDEDYIRPESREPLQAVVPTFFVRRHRRTERL